MKPITQEMIARMHADFQSDRMNRTLQAVCAKTDLAELAYVPENGAKLNGEFSLELKTMSVTAQQKSGRCWAFAGMNIMREIVAKKCGLEEFELSGNYIAFWDKLEKCNDVLEMVIKYADLPFGDRMMDYIAYGIWDGGYWDMFVDIVKKYGVAPKSAMPETWTSAHTDTFMSQLNRLLRKDGAELKAMIARGEDPTARKEEMLSEIYKALSIVFGEPVQKFDFSWRDKDKEYHIDRDLTPKAFYEKYVGLEVENYITIVNEPTPRKPMGKAFTFHYIGNMAESMCLCLNLPIEDLKQLAITQMKDGEPVWFACDVGHASNRKQGILDPASFDYGAILGGIDLSMSKSDGIEWKESNATHAMLLTGVNFGADGNPDRWKVENSWGSEVGNKGYFVCSDAYFDEYVYEVIINKKYLSDAQKAMLAEEPIEVLPWNS